MSAASYTFQSTPDLINRENVVFSPLNGGHSRFQSTPDLINRENDGWVVDHATGQGFNPLPI